MTEHSANVTDNGFCRHSTEGNDLRYRFAAVQLGHVVNNLITSIHAEVDVKVGHGNTLRVQEAFKQ